MTDTQNDSLERLLRMNCPASCDGNGTFVDEDWNGDPEPAQCQWCYEYGMPARKAIEQYGYEQRIEEREWVLTSILTKAKDVAYYDQLSGDGVLEYTELEGIAKLQSLDTPKEGV